MKSKGIFVPLLCLIIMSKREKNAFTLTEAILTLIIISVLSIIILPRFGGTGPVLKSKLRLTSSQIAADIGYARQLAITNSRTHIIKFDFTQKEYRIYQDSILPANQIGETKIIPQDITCSGTDQFDFYEIGNVVFSGAGLLLSLGASQYQITAEQPTGAVLVEKIS